MFQKKTILLIFLIFIESCQNHGIDNNYVADIIIYNKTSNTIYFQPIDEDMAQIIDWLPSKNINFENQVIADRKIEIMFDEVWGYNKNNNILFYYWHIIKNEFGEYEIENFRAKELIPKNGQIIELQIEE